MARRRSRSRRRARPASPPAALEDEDLLRKIFLLLPPQPSTIPRVSVVCKQWRGVVRDPQFLRGFRDHHRKPPLLGLVMGHTGHPYFRSDLDPPDHIPHERFFPPDILSMYMDLFDCRHGRVVFFDHQLREVMLFDPATGGRRHVVVPPVFDEKDIGVFNAAVICVAGDEGHVHGDCHTSPFQVVLIGIHDDNKRAFASVYSSETGTWGELISTAAIRYMRELSRPSTLVGDSVYWVFDGNEDGILKFDLDKHSLVNIEMPDFGDYSCWSSFKIMSTDDGSFGLAALEYQKIEMWEREVDCDGVAGWVLQKTFQMNTILGLGPMGGMDNLMLGYDEDDRAIYVRTDIGVCIIQLDTMQFRNLGKDNFTTTAYYPYKSFYTAVSDLSVCERRVGGISRSLAKDDSIMVPASRGAGAAGDNAAAASTRTIPGDMLDKSNSRVQGIDTGLVPSRVLTQTRIDVIFKKEMETRSKLTKAWAKWFRSNGIPESKADCPHFRNAMKLTLQLGTHLPVPTGGELGGVNLDAEEELP
ncbi:unnamed protein product [Triticum turgidum subsp. durum]|uniref:F-box domain-containing protein n=1 Tax=Triticum turgidum subsp. durum TaxID=4567 RepID=A0A9R1RJX2_TRITD|nr:unnamed protein product [Triticum turgidum subsp. durum]